jgi:transmembrane sensor
MSAETRTSEARLPVPVRRVLDDALDEVALQRAYAGVRARRAANERAESRGSRPVFALLAAAVLVAVGLFFWFRPRDPGPVALRSGAPFVAIEASLATDAAATDDASTELALDDGSTIALASGAKLVPLENGGQRVLLLLERGEASFEVQPGGPRRWTIECGAATVEVVGTGFTIDRTSASLRVDVRHGVVLVRGDAVPDHVRKLTAGESIEIATSDSRAASDVSLRAPASVASAPAPAVTASAAPSARSSAQSPASAWHDLASKGAYGDAYALLGASGIRERATAASADELFLLADVARLSGHAGDAVAPLERIVAEHPTDPRAALAAFTLGKLYAGNPGAAASMFEQSLAMGLPGSLQSDARARWADACRRMNDATCEARAMGKSP